MSEIPRHLIRTSHLPAAETMRVRHPLNPNSSISMHLLSRAVGMKRAHVSLARVPPGKDSFADHAHALQEEWLYILEGRGLALIGDQEVEVGPGDFLGFPTDGAAHNLRNIGETDLVYLVGGESTELEVARFPSAGKVAIFEGDTVRLFDETAAELRTVSDWIEKPGN